MYYVLVNIFKAHILYVQGTEHTMMTTQMFVSCSIKPALHGIDPQRGEGITEGGVLFIFFFLF